MSDRQRYYHLRTTLIHDRRGQPRGHLFVISDVTELKEVEQQLQQANQSLGHEIADRPWSWSERTGSFRKSWRNAAGRTENLQESEERARSVLETAYDAFISIESDGTVTDWNPQAEVTFGWTREQALGRNLADMLILEDQPEEHSRGLERYLTTEHLADLKQRAEVTALHRDGHHFPRGAQRVQDPPSGVDGLQRLRPRHHGKEAGG